MNKILNYCTMLAFSMLVLMLGACTDEYEHTGATAEGEQVYFKTDLAKTHDLELTKNSFQVEINRINKAGELTVGITANQQNGSIFTVPSTVTFADGETSAMISISYDPNKLESCGYGYYEDITLNVGETQFTTPYGESSCTISAGLTEWVTTDQEVDFRDGLMSGAFGIEAMTYKVKLQKSNVKEGRYRLLNPYGEGTPVWDMFMNTTVELNNDHGIIFDISDPNYVFFDGITNVGTFNGDQLIFVSQAYYIMVTQGATIDDLKQSQDVDVFFGKYRDGIVTLQPKSHIGELGDGTITGQPSVYGNPEGLLTIAMPGYEIADYSSKFTYKGRFTDVSNKEYAQGSIALGEDVAAARWVLAADGDDIESVVEMIKNGSMESNYITGNEDVEINIQESGKYTLVIVTYDKEGKARSHSATTFTFTLSAEVEVADWQAVYVGNFRYNVYPNFVTDQAGNFPGSLFPEGQHETVLYQDANNPSKYKLEPWGATTESALLFDMDNETGIASFEDVETGYVHEEVGMVYVADCSTLLGGKPTSSMIETGLQFGNVYYFLQSNGEKGYTGGAVEYFDITAEAGSNSYMVKAIENKKNIKMLKPVNVKPVKRDIQLKTGKIKVLKVK